MRVTTLAAPEIAREGSVESIRKALSPLAGIADVRVDGDARTITVRHDPDLISVASIVMRLDHLGFCASETTSGPAG